MPKVKIDPFSNGTEAMLWEERNCGRCVKGSFLKEDEKTGELRYTNADSHKLPRCRIQRDIMLRSFGDVEIDEETVEVCRSFVMNGTPCPRLLTSRPKRSKKNNGKSIQLSLEL